MRIANIFWLFTSLLLWAGMAWAEPHPVLGEFDVLKVEKLLKETPPLYPVWEGSSRDYEGMKRAFARLAGRRIEELRPPSIPVCDTSVADMDAVYQRVFPYPELRSIRAESGPLYPMPFGPPRRKAIGVRGVRVHMRWQPKTPFFPEIPMAEDTETWEEEVWRWLLPDEFHKPIDIGVGDYIAGRHRYVAAFLYRQQGTEIVGTVVACFDTTSGLCWMSPVPLWEAVEHVQATSGEEVRKRWEEDRKFHQGNTAVTQDGSRILVVTSSHSARQILLFVYNEKGKVIRTRVLDGVYFIDPGLSRYYADNVFALTFSTRDSGIPRYSVLLDKEGDFLCWFADDPAKAEPTNPYLYGDQHAVCSHSGKWLIYRLPEGNRERQ